MKRLLVLLLMLLPSLQAHAAYINRFSSIANGAVTFTGNTLGLDKGTNVNAPGATGSIGTFITTNSLLQDGTFPAGTTSQWQQSSSAAVLNIPAGSTILYAELIWGGSYSYGGENVSASLNTSVTLTTPTGTYSISPSGTTSQTQGTAGANGTCTSAAACDYIRSQTVTTQVTSGGAGTYSVGGVPGTEAASENNNNTAGWTLVVVYGNFTLPLRSLTVFVGAEKGGNSAASISGFCAAPAGNPTGRLFVSALEGDSGFSGDQMMFGPTPGNLSAVSGPNNQVNNFFASQINKDDGTLNTSGTFGSSNQSDSAFGIGRQGYDITSVDVSSLLTNSQTSAFAQGTTNQDQYVINGLGLQIDVGVPKLTTTKSVNKATTYAGDTLTYTVLIDNTAGLANANNVTFTDAPPAGTTFVANSFTVGGSTVNAAVPANGVNIGTVAAGTTQTVTFQVTIASLPTAPAVAQYSNAATWTYQYVSCAGQPTLNGSITSNTVITTVPRLTPTKTVSPSGAVYPGQTLTYTITVPNSGTAATSGTTLSDAIPTGTTYVLNSTTLNGAAASDFIATMPYATSGQINSPAGAAGQIKIGETATVTFKVTVNAATTAAITNTATIDPDGNGPAPTQTAQVTSGVARLTVAKAVSPTGAIAPGQTVTYTITAQNTGSGPSSGTTLADPIPSGFTYVAGSTKQNGAAVADIAGAMPYTNAAAINSPSGAAGAVVNGETATIVFQAKMNASPGAGPITNTATVDPDGSGPAAATTAQASSTVAIPDVILTKSHSGSFSVGAVGTYTLQVSASALGGQVGAAPITVVDNLPNGLTIAAAPTGTNWDCSATVVASVTGSCTYTGTFPVAAGSALAAITLTVNVAAAASPQVTNSATVQPVTGETVTANNTATDLTTVTGKPTITKAFAPGTIAINGTSTLTLTLSNSSAAILTGVNFSDPFPSGLVVAATPAVTNTCGGTTSGGTAGATSIGLGNGGLLAGVNCTISVAVTSATAGQYANTTAGVASTQTGTAGSVSNTATLQVLAKPTVTKSFSPTQIGVGEPSTMTIAITNAGTGAHSGVAFTDSYPANLVNATPANLTNTCGGVISGGTAGGSNVGLTGGAVAATSSCSITVNVTATAAGSLVNSTGVVTTTNAGSSTAASSTLTAVAKTAITKSFGPTTIGPSGTSTLTLTITNANTFALTSVGFTDAFPSGLVVAGTPALTNSCGGSISGGTAGSGTLALSGGSMTASSTCTITVAVTATNPNLYTNTAGGVTSAQWSGTGPVSNSSSLTVLAPPVIAESFSANPIGTLGSSTLTITITNPNATTLTGIAFTDTYPAGGMGNVSTPGTANSCGGTATGASLGGSLSLTGGTLAGNSSCTVTTTVGSATAGTFNNVTSAVTSTNGGTGNTASATLIVSANPYITKDFTPTRINTGGTSTLTLTLSNVLSLGQSSVSFTDTFPSGLVVAATPASSNTCGGSLSGTTAGSGSIALSGGSIGILSTCTITVPVTSASGGNYANATSALHTATGTYNTSNTATLQVIQSPSMAKSFSPATILTGGTSTLSLVITNPNGIPLTGVAFTDAFPTNLVVSGIPTVTNSCAGTLSGTGAGSTSISLAGGTVPGSSTCTITIQVTSAVGDSLASTTSGVSSNEAATGAASNTATLTVNAVDLQVKKSHSGTFVAGATGVYTITVNNIAGTGATSGTITVTDTLPTGLTYVPGGSGGTGWTCSASGRAVTCTSTSSIAAAGTAPAITLNVSVAAVAAPSVTNQATVAGGGEAAANANNNTASDYTLVAYPAQTTFSTSGQQTSAAGTVIFYSHAFMAGYDGTVTFGTADTPTPTVSGWSSSLFRDTNCNGILDGSEGTTVLSGSVAVAASAQVCVIEKVFIPATATYGAKDQTVVTAAFTPTSTGSSATLTQTDVTTAGGASGTGLTLQKTVRNVTTGGTATANNTAISGQTLEYTIIYSNASAAPLNSIVVSDFTAGFTVFVSAQCTTPLPASLTACNVTTQPSVGGQGSLIWTLAGSLQSGASGSVLFRVTLQ